VPGLRGATSIRARPGIASDLDIGVFIGLRRRLRLIKLQQTTRWRLILV
jgi:hypothetical protein